MQLQFDTHNDADHLFQTIRKQDAALISNDVAMKDYNDEIATGIINTTI